MNALEIAIKGLTDEKLLLSNRLSQLRTENSTISTRSSIMTRLAQIDNEIKNLLTNLQNHVTTEKDDELQKARHDWLREEIVRLDGMKVENEHNSECLHNEAPEYCDCDNYIKWNKALQTIIDRYLAELDQDKV